MAGSGKLYGVTGKRQRGVTLLEVLVSLGIMAGVLSGVAQLADQYIEDTKSALAAQQMVAVGNAAQAYIKDNYTTVMANATAAAPALITVPMLTTAGYLQSGFSTTNNFGQSVCVLVLEPTANNLNALVIAEGGTTIDDLTLGAVAVSIGASGGGVYSTATTTLRGAMGGWSMAVGNYASANNLNQRCNGAAGVPTIAAGRPIMALWFSNGDATSGFLYRNAVPGRPELNTMNTPILMESVQTSGAACATTGAIARDNTGAVLSCQTGAWRSQGSAFWKDPVANYASLPLTGDSVGAVRMTLDTGRGFMWSGATWGALALDQNGDLSIPGNLVVNGNTTIGDAGTDSLLVNAGATFNSGVTIGDGTAASSTNTLVVNRTATEGAACTPNGAVARDATGLILSCQSAVWKPNSKNAMAFSGTFSRSSTSWATYTVGDYPVCFLLGVGESGSNGRCYMTQTGPTWTITLRSSYSTETYNCQVGCIN